MNKYFSLALIGCFLASICYEWVFPGWSGYYLSKLLIIATISGILWHKIPYSELMFKSVAFIVFLDAIWNIGQFIMNGAYQGPLELLNAVIFLPWLAYAMLRSYEVKSVVPHIDRVYMVTHSPDNFTGFILSIFKRPVGGSGIWIHGNTYSFHKGVFEVHSRVPPNAIFIETGIDTKPEIEAYLKNKIGQHWKLWNNCLTTLWKVRLCLRNK